MRPAFQFGIPSIMQKPLALSIAACLALTGCALSHKSPTWDKVVRTRIALPPGGDASRVYADGLHHELKAARVEHRVVTYQYRYDTRLREDAVVERTSVIYRDDSNAKYPWWIKDERSGRPTWLPNGSVQQQLRFYVGRDVEILDPGKGYGGGGKQVAPIKRHRHAAAAASTDAGAIFERAHGTAYNAASAMDREKLAALLRARNATASLRDF
jgi:hypothetical protein